MIQKETQQHSCSIDVIFVKKNTGTIPKSYVEIMAYVAPEIF